jgi:hypothetical protein
METAELNTDNASFENETTRVRAWRQQRFVALGYPLSRATLLASTAIDIHEVEHLIDRGCPLDLAVRIAG